MTAPLSLDDLPRDLSRGARAALAFCLLRCRTDTGEIEWVDGMHPAERVRRWCGWDSDSQAFAALAELRRKRLIRREGHAKQRRFYVVNAGSLLFSGVTRACEICDEPVAKMRGAKRCPKCIQIQRREWKADLLAIWRNGKDRGWSDDKIAFTAHVRLRRPLWGYAEDGVKGSGSGSGEGIIPALVEMGLVDPSMMERARFARRGGEPDEVD